MVFITPKISVPDEELHESFVRSSGAGGQNVNKVATAVELRFSIANNWTIPYDVKQRLTKLGGRRVTQEGELVLFVQTHRTQDMNRKAALERFVELVRKAAEPPPPPRVKTKPTQGSVRRRLLGKAIRSTVKANRGKVAEDDEG
ncbi:MULTISPECIES: alternative ribosome rescue aminoacyl-tRNA hydrolase ArfB [Asticcacaulis]|uniref:alternative ribosome rescue aminoacyl-tRNA hydrolase ArfB n=1 Tax=Asticcacaulis TaxID=76890 RepID=UPI001AE581DC|nr:MULTISPECIES: alternative ribosome rescue aminoacyl-tRNA hydrolase ArfB [Asticcacaulis]MBP2160906.1 ribosome-associated protein [Asticcacaulis solisilvae]MDR6801890.1 ribosome-associated protein [Asticcacaulis sp. BE141]